MARSTHLPYFPGMSDAVAATSVVPTEASAKGSGSSGAAGSLPRVFGRLVLLKLLARGGMGDVYLAATTGIEGAERPIVVKTIRRDHIHDGSFLARFLDEARVQAQLNHPGVAQVLEASTDESGEPYTVVEYVEGRSLADVRQRAVQTGIALDWPDAVAIVIEVAQALSHVHERSGADGTPLGIVHRDLSPQNVMVGYAGEVKLIDFGTARGHNRRCHTVAGVVFAKPGYVAPEVARQQVGDGRIDLYAVGVMLWELCAGKRFLVGDAQRHMENVASGRAEVARLNQTRKIPSELDDIIQNLCANDPDHRYASAAVAVRDLGRLLTQTPPSTSGERSVRARVSSLMKTLWPHEPARSRAEFAKLLKQGRALRRETMTPPSSSLMQMQAEQMTDLACLSGTPYRLGRKIGEGSSGEVYEAEHTELGRKYAVKILSPAHTAAEDAIARFRREARAVARLSHPNLVALHDFGKALDGRVFLVMELLSGTTLDTYCEKGLSIQAALRIAVEATWALEAAHAAGLVHRDLKPQNLFITKNGELKLLDFGVAMTLAEPHSDKKHRGFAVFGTPEYMAPEQAAGDPVDARCDLYALGCVLYELVTGSRPFGGSPVVVMGLQLRELPERPCLRAPERHIPREVEALIMKALEKDREHRFASARAMRDALEQALTVPVRRRTRARGVVVAAVSACVSILAVGGLRARNVAVGTETVAGLARGSQTTLESSATTTSADPFAPSLALDLPESVPSENRNVKASGDGLAGAQATAGSTHVDESSSRRAALPSPLPTPSPVPSIDSAQPLSALPPSGARTALTQAVLHGSPTDETSKLAQARLAAQREPTDPAALRAWANAAVAAGEFREARRAAETWALHDPSEEPRLVLARALDESGRKRDAKSVLESWLQAHPGSSASKRLLARLSATTDAAIKGNNRARRVE